MDIQSIHIKKHVFMLLLTLTMVAATIDMHCFVYPSLSRSLLMEIGVTTISILLLFNSLITHTFSITKFDVFIIVWIGYILIHTTLIVPHEVYRMLYLCSTLLFMLVLSLGIRKGIVQRRAIENVILFIAIIHLCYMTGQLLGLIKSGNDFFCITGSNENPTITAIYLSACTPLTISRARKSRYKIPYILLFIATSFAILFLRCRTAYIGLGISIIIYAIIEAKSMRLRITKHFGSTIFAIITLSPFLIISMVKMYHMKQDSADGRLLIWKLSTSMLLEQPLGYGYGLFEKNYNLKQADYFENGTPDQTEKRNADCVNMAYNDYLEHGVEGGVIGMLIFGLFFSILIRKTLKRKKAVDAAVVIAFAFMALSNFIYSSIQPWLILICYAAFNNSAPIDTQRISPFFKIRTFIGYILLISTIIGLTKISDLTKAQFLLNRIENERKDKGSINDKMYSNIEESISTSEAFWKSRALNYISSKKPHQAISALAKARNYSSSPDLFYREIEPQLALGRIDEAVSILKTLTYLQPRNLSIKNRLMLVYIRYGRINLALNCAQDILTTEIKNPSAETNRIKEIAHVLKRKYEK